MRVRVVIAALSLAITISGAPAKHWTETSAETIWRGRYKNCDHGYEVILPAGIVAHDSLPPLPNHGIGILASEPGNTAEITWEESRLIDIYDSFDASELGSARAYLENELKSEDRSEKITVVEKLDTKFRGLPAAYARFLRVEGSSISETEELVIYRTPKNISPTFYGAILRTTSQFYSHDQMLFLRVPDGMHFLSVPAGECSND